MVAVHSTLEREAGFAKGGIDAAHPHLPPSPRGAHAFVSSQGLSPAWPSCPHWRQTLATWPGGQRNSVMAAVGSRGVPRSTPCPWAPETARVSTCSPAKGTTGLYYFLLAHGRNHEGRFIPHQTYSLADTAKPLH